MSSFTWQYKFQYQTVFWKANNKTRIELIIYKSISGHMNRFFFNLMMTFLLLLIDPFGNIGWNVFMHFKFFQHLALNFPEEGKSIYVLLWFIYSLATILIWCVKFFYSWFLLSLLIICHREGKTTGKLVQSFPYCNFACPMPKCSKSYIWAFFSVLI